MHKPHLKRELGLFELTVAGVGIIIGAGIYALIGVAAKTAGNATWISFLISSFIALFTGLSYAELSSMFRGDAGEYDYVKSALSKKFGFFIGMVMILGTIISSGAVALGFAGYFTKLIPMNAVLAAILLIVLMGLINFKGIKETHWFNSVSAFAEIAGVVIIILIGITHFGDVNYFEAPAGIPGILGSAALVFFAFLGFESLVKFREETKDPDKTIPRAIILSIFITSILYVLVALSAVSILGWEKLSSTSAPMALVASTLFGKYAFLALAIAALSATSNTVLLTMVAGSRQLYGMAQEHSLPKFLTLVHPKTGTPWAAILVSMIVAAVFAMLGDIAIVANITNLFLFVAFAAVNLSMMILRYKEPDRKRGFKCPGNIGNFSVVALLGLLTSLGMIVFVLINLF